MVKVWALDLHAIWPRFDPSLVSFSTGVLTQEDATVERVPQTFIPCLLVFMSLYPNSPLLLMLDTLCNSSHPFILLILIISPTSSLCSPILSGIRVLTASRMLACFDIYPNINRIKKVKAPVFVIHGDHDEEVGFHHGYDLHCSGESSVVVIDLLIDR